MPIIAGVDKFFHVLVDWNQYLAPQIPLLLGVSPRSLMMMAGAIEIAAGVGVALRPRTFAYGVAAWLAGIIANLLIHPIGFYDIALRDLGLSLGAVALGRLAAVLDHKILA